MLACRPHLGQFFIDHGLADEVIEIDKRSPTGRRSALKQLQRETWDLVFVPHESPRTALWMARIKAQRARVGFRKWWNRPFYGARVVKPKEYPDALRQLSLLAPFDNRLAEWFGDEGVQELRNPFSFESPLELFEPEIPEWASMKVRHHQPIGEKIFLAPGSVWDTKRWTRQGYIDLARMLLNRGYHVELVGSGGERALCQEIADSVAGVVNRAGETSLTELVQLFSTGRALVSNDSGAMHAAAAADLPTVAIFGPTTLTLGFRPWNNRAVVIQRDLKCRPCGRHGSQKCPIGTHECMERISATEVFATVEKLIARTSS